MWVRFPEPLLAHPAGERHGCPAVLMGCWERGVTCPRPVCALSVPCSPLIQFNLLHSKFHLCSVPTRALLLSTYIKFVNLFPEVKTTIQDVLRSDSQLKNADVELQQRAVEYLRLSTVASTDILVGPGRSVPLLRCHMAWGWRPQGFELW